MNSQNNGTKKQSTIRKYFQLQYDFMPFRITKQWLEKNNFEDQQDPFQTLDVIYQTDKKKKLKNSVLVNYNPFKPLKTEIAPAQIKA
jgi:hypothetical protein